MLYISKWFIGHYDKTLSRWGWFEHRVVGRRFSSYRASLLWTRLRNRNGSWKCLRILGLKRAKMLHGATSWHEGCDCHHGHYPLRKLPGGHCGIVDCILASWAQFLKWAGGVAVNWRGFIWWCHCVWLQEFAPSRDHGHDVIMYAFSVFVVRFFIDKDYVHP